MDLKQREEWLMKNIEIAEMLKISPATVSLALNNKPGVSEETKKKVFELRDSLLKRDIDSRSKDRELGTIGLLVFKNRSEIISDTPFFVQTIDYISSEIIKRGYEFSIIYSTADDNDSLVESINPLDLRCLIIVGTEMTKKDVEYFQQHLKVPFVITDAYFPDCDVDTVLMDNFSGITLSMQYAYKLGHRKIGFLATDKECNNFRDRYYAFLSNMNILGLDSEECPIVRLPLGIEESRDKMSEYLRDHSKLPTVYVADNDRTAMGAMEALKNAGYKVPEDVSIIGFDDMPVVQFLTPSLTSIRLNQEVIAKTAVERAIQLIDESIFEHNTVQQLVSVGLTVRASVCEPRR